MGVVYLAERTDIGGQVAIKLLRDGWLSPERRAAVSHGAADAGAAQSSRHRPHLRLQHARRRHSMVRDGVRGRPLHLTKLEPAGRHDTRLPGLIRRVCEAVQYAHSHAIIHRDPQAFEYPRFGRRRIKRPDFGIAKQLNSEESMENRTITGLSA